MRQLIRCRFSSDSDDALDAARLHTAAVAFRTKRAKCVVRPAGWSPERHRPRSQTLQSCRLSRAVARVLSSYVRKLSCSGNLTKPGRPRMIIIRVTMTWVTLLRLSSAAKKDFPMHPDLTAMRFAGNASFFPASQGGAGARCSVRPSAKRSPRCAPVAALWSLSVSWEPLPIRPPGGYIA